MHVITAIIILGISAVCLVSAIPKFEGFVVTTTDSNAPNVKQVRAVRNGVMALQTQEIKSASDITSTTETTNGKTLVRITYRDFNVIESCDITHGRIKIRKFYRRFLKNAPLGPAVMRKFDRKKEAGNVTSDNEKGNAIDAVISRAIKVFSTSTHTWNRTLIVEYGPLTNHQSKLHHCRKWRKQNVTKGQNGISNQNNEDELADDENDDDEVENNGEVRSKRNVVEGFVAIQPEKYGTSEVRAVRNGKLTLQTKVAREEGNVIITETTNGNAIVKMIYKEPDVLEDCEISWGQFKLRKFYRRFLGDKPLGPAVIRATAHHRKGEDRNVTLSEQREYVTAAYRPGDGQNITRLELKKQVVNVIKNRALKALRDSAQPWNNELIHEYGPMTNFRKQIQRCRAWREKHGVTEEAANTVEDSELDELDEGNDNSSNVDVKLEQKENTKRKRVKKDTFIYFDTKWCGMGASATDEADIGKESEADKCCREHDQCPYHIASFTTKYGLFNYRLTTVSLCDCDFRFRTCLRNWNTDTADKIGNIFFNVVATPCFRFKYENVCVERTWYGKCLRHERQPKAVMHNSLSY